MPPQLNSLVILFREFLPKTGHLNSSIIFGLQTDQHLLDRLRARWPYILEDEAQDSSFLQEKILRLLTEKGNWVPVGDPNQSINTTFTTSSIRFLNQFLAEPGVVEVHIVYSGRSNRRSIALANYLLDWTIADHPDRNVRANASRPQHIEPTPPDDPQPNPIDVPDDIVRLYNEALSPEKELDLVVKSIGRWLPPHPDQRTLFSECLLHRRNSLTRGRPAPWGDYVRNSCPAVHKADHLPFFLP